MLLPPELETCGRTRLLMVSGSLVCGAADTQLGKACARRRRYLLRAAMGDHLGGLQRAAAVL